MSIVEYPPRKSNGKTPAIIGLPGFVNTLRGRRINDTLEKLSQNGIHGYGLVYSSFHEDNGRVIHDFDTQTYIKEIAQVIEQTINNPRIDQNKTGIISTSMSAGLFAEYLAEVDAPPIQCYLTISPFAGWKYFATPEIREQLKKGDYIPITTPSDKLQGIERLIPTTWMQQIESFDALGIPIEKLRNRFPILTIMSTQDTTSEPRSMARYHAHFGGTPNNLLSYDEYDHEIPIEATRKPILSFLRENLLHEAA
jgi:hypothetical protein